MYATGLVLLGIQVGVLFTGHWRLAFLAGSWPMLVIPGWKAMRGDDRLSANPPWLFATFAIGGTIFNVGVQLILT